MADVRAVTDVPEELVTAAAETLFRLDGYDGDPPTEAELAHYTEPARIALAAAFAKLAGCIGMHVEPAIYAHRRLPSGRLSDFHDKNSVHMDGCIPLYDLAAILAKWGQP